LYDLENDPAEEKNLIESNPEKATEIKTLLTKKIRGVE